MFVEEDTRVLSGALEALIMNLLDELLVQVLIVTHIHVVAVVISVRIGAVLVRRGTI